MHLNVRDPCSKTAVVLTYLESFAQLEAFRFDDKQHVTCMLDMYCLHVNMIQMGISYDVM